MSKRRLIVIGGGFAGGAFALHLLRHNPTLSADIEIIEPKPLLGAGLAYSTTDPTHRINVAAARMAVYAEDPTHFDRWFRESGEADKDPAALIADGRAYPRRLRPLHVTLRRRRCPATRLKHLPLLRPQANFSCFEDHPKLESRITQEEKRVLGPERTGLLLIVNPTSKDLLRYLSSTRSSRAIAGAR